VVRRGRLYRRRLIIVLIIVVVLVLDLVRRVVSQTYRMIGKSIYTRPSWVVALCRGAAFFEDEDDDEYDYERRTNRRQTPRRRA
jgi:hypothetical protein